MLQYIFYKTLRIFHIISKQQFREKTAYYDDNRKISLISHSPLFDKQWYIEQTPEVATQKIDAAKHYFKQGWKEGRNPSPYFDGNNYLERYDDVADAGKNPLVHYLTDGIKEGREYIPSVEGMHIENALETSFFSKITYILKYPIRIKDEYDQLLLEIRILKHKK